MSRLSEAERSRFEIHGVVAPLPLLSLEQAAKYRMAVEAMQHACGAFRRADQLHLHFTWARQLAAHPALLDTVESLLGSDLLVHGVLLMCKPAHSAAAVPWHQDSVYSGWHLSPSASAWIALTESSERNGCMRVIEGSHQQGVLAHDERPSSDVLLRRGETVREPGALENAKDILLEPGQMSLHHCNVVHGSRPNRSAGSRIGFIVRFVTSEYPRRGCSVVRVRGRGDDSHLQVRTLGSLDREPQPFTDEIATWIHGLAPERSADNPIGTQAVPQA